MSHCVWLEAPLIFRFTKVLKSSSYIIASSRKITRPFKIKGRIKKETCNVSSEMLNTHFVVSVIKQFSEHRKRECLPLTTLQSD